MWIDIFSYEASVSWKSISKPRFVLRPSNLQNKFFESNVVRKNYSANWCHLRIRIHFARSNCAISIPVFCQFLAKYMCIIPKRNGITKSIFSETKPYMKKFNSTIFYIFNLFLRKESRLFCLYRDFRYSFYSNYRILITLVEEDCV